jgi:hypothetical protein
MSRLATTLFSGILTVGLIAGSALAPAAAAMAGADAAAMKKATANCKAEVNEKAKYQAMSLVARHKMVKDCVKESLARPH